MKFTDPTPQYGGIMAGIYVKSQEQTILLQAALHEAMKVTAGKPEEEVLAVWYNQLESIKRKAVSENWTGWAKVC